MATPYEAAKQSAQAMRSGAGAASGAARRLCSVCATPVSGKACKGKGRAMWCPSIDPDEKDNEHEFWPGNGYVHCQVCSEVHQAPECLDGFDGEREGVDDE